MTSEELHAYQVGLYNLPGNYDHRVWPTMKEQMAWQRGRRERAERLAREGDVTPTTKRPTFSVFMGQLAGGLGALGGMAGFVIGFGLKGGPLVLQVVLTTIAGILAGAAGPLIIRFIVLRIGRLISRSRYSKPPR